MLYKNRKSGKTTIQGSKIKAWEYFKKEDPNLEIGDVKVEISIDPIEKIKKEDKVEKPVQNIKQK
jgi:hypothetical protein